MRHYLPDFNRKLGKALKVSPFVRLPNLHKQSLDRVTSLTNHKVAPDRERSANLITFAHNAKANNTTSLVAPLKLIQNQPRQPAPLHTNQNNDNTSSILSTPIDCYKLRSFLQGYDVIEQEFLYSGFQSGFHIPFTGNRSFRFSNNLPSAQENTQVLLSKIENELLLGRVAGPFDTIPIYNIQISPLGVVPKKAPGEFRIIHHLSYPDGNSINDGICKDLCSVSYQSIDHATKYLIKFGKGALMSNTDIENAYRIVPINPKDYDLLGFSIDGKFYYDKSLPFGLSYSCRLFERFSTAIHWILVNKFGIPACVHILDDFLFIGPPESNSCRNSLYSFYRMSDALGIPIKHTKTVPPTTTITFLGLELDSIEMEVRLPAEKLDKLRLELVKMQNKRKPTLQELQSLIGLLNFAYSVVVPGRAFLRRIIDLTLGIKKSYHYRSLNLSARADISAWLFFIENFNGRALILPEIVLSSDEISLHTDASNLGMGCCLGSRWFSCSFDESMLKYDITVREFLPIVIALELWPLEFQNKRIQFLCDNMAVVHIINKHSSKDAFLMNLMRRLMVLVLKNNIFFRAVHLPGKFNIAADLLSRLQVEEFLTKFPEMDNLFIY